MNLTEDLKNKETSILNKVVDAASEEEVDANDHLTVAKLLLGAVKVKVDVEALDKLGDRIAVVVRLLLNEAYQIFHAVTSLPVSNDSSTQITQNVRTRRLDGVQVGVLRVLVAHAFGVKEELHQHVTALFNVEKDKQAPVDEPGALLKGLSGRKVGVVNVALDHVEVIQRLFVLQRQNRAHQVAPHDVHVVFILRRDQHLVGVEEANRLGILRRAVVHASKVVQKIHFLRRKLKTNGK